LVANYLGAGASAAWKGVRATPGAVSSFVRDPRTATGAKVLAGAGVIGTGAAIGEAGGRVWDYEGRGLQGALAGAAIVGAAVTGRGISRLGRTGMKTLSKQGYLVSNMALGAGIGAVAGPTDSTLANITYGAMGGAAGGLMGARIGSRMAAGFKMGPRGLYGGLAAGGNVRSPHVYFGKLAGPGTGMIDKFATRGRRLSTAHIGGTATALFAPAAAHGLIGGSRRDKSMNKFNRY
jgi:hypothetical protein